MKNTRARRPNLRAQRTWFGDWVCLIATSALFVGCLPAGSSGSGTVNASRAGGATAVGPVIEETASVDGDGDGVADEDDAFPDDATETVDSDGDGVGDNADVFPEDESEWADEDGDGVGDNRDLFPTNPDEFEDEDGDGVGDNRDNCRIDVNEDQADLDFDGLGDECDDENNLGVAAYDDFRTEFALNTRFEFTTTVSIDAFDREGRAVDVMDFVRAHDQDNGIEYTASEIVCSSPSERSSYDAFMLFDRSGSMSESDPMDDSRRAAKAFVDNLGESDRAFVAEFGSDNISEISSTNGWGYNEISDDFSDQPGRLRSDIDEIGAPLGDTPLWLSMSKGLDRIAESSLRGQRRALLTFSDGEDTAGEMSPSAVIDSAKAKNTRVYAINLANANSEQVDRVALETGGSIFSTSDASELIRFYGALGQLLAGQSIKCKLTVTATAPAAGDGQQRKAFGPGGVPQKIRYGFRTGNGDTVAVELQSSMVLGRRQGTNGVGGVIYQSDISAKASGAENMTAQSDGYFVVCLDDDLRRCDEGFVRAGMPLPRPSAEATQFRFASCAAVNGFRFRPALQESFDEADGTRRFEYRPISNVAETEVDGSVCVFEDALFGNAQ